MSLLTPPSTAHRQKELGCPSSRLVWAAQNVYHSFTSSPPRLSVSASASRERPTRSILKKLARVILPEPEEMSREVTPEPSDPLADLHYLERLVTIITSVEAPLRDLVDAYNQLTTRLRAVVNDRTDADCSWPLFHPLRQQREAFVAALSRDLSKPLIDPAVGDENSPASCDTEPKTFLPSPKASPSRKRHGLTEEQVTYARDLFSTAQAALKFLTVALALPAVCGVFTALELRSILTDVLAIPMAEQLPTPNARKTYGSATLVLQVQRLPEEILLPARDRIAYALRRAIEGELGKEGKRGATFEGLKAVHDLSLYQPATFVPPFTELLSSVLAGLLAPTLLLRTQAAHALGGYALALTTLPLGSFHTRASAQVAEFFTAPPSKARKVTSSPSSPSHDSLIVRTLRTTLNTPDPAHPAQGPAWALCVLASFVVILGSRVYTESKILRSVNALLKMTMKHRKSTVRGLGCMVWRAVTWVYFQPALPVDEEDDSADEGEPEVDEDERQDIAERRDRDVEAARERYWETVQSIVEMGTGVCTVAALLGDESISRDDEQALRRSIFILRSLIKKGGEHIVQALDALQQLLGPFAIPEDSTLEETLEAKNQVGEWEFNKLLAPGLFSAHPGVLTAEYKSLSTAVRPLFEQSADAGDIRWLTKAELATEWVHDGLVSIWRDAMLALKWPKDAQTLTVEMSRLWSGLLSSRTDALAGQNHVDGDVRFAGRVAAVLVEFIQDPTFCLSEDQSTETCSPSPLASKFIIVRVLLAKIRKAMPSPQANEAASKLLPALISNSSGLDSTYDALETWGRLCGDVLVMCEVEELKAFCDMLSLGNTADLGWTCLAEARCVIWRQLVKIWREDNEANWEGSISLLSAPFASSEPWEMDSEDFHAWDALLQLTMDKASDCGHDRSSVLSNVAEAMSRIRTSSTLAPTRVADLLVSSLDMADVREVPTKLMDFVNDSLVGAYPSSPHDHVACFWLVRSLTRAIETCPAELVSDLLASVQDGMCVWISDEYNVMTEDDYALNMLPMYQTVLFSIQTLEPSVEVLVKSQSILHSGFHGRADKPEAVAQSFRAFWETSYAFIEPPMGGWPAQLRTCLNALSPEKDHRHSTVELGASAEPVVAITQLSIDDDEPLSFPDSDEDEEPTSFLKPTLMLEKATHSPVSGLATPCRASSPASTPYRPTKRLSIISAPQLIFPSLLSSPAGSAVPMTPKRTPASPARSSKGRTTNKENVSPCRIMSVMDRMVARFAESPTKLGKRRDRMDEGDIGDLNHERSSKRSKLASANPILPSPKVNMLANAQGAISHASSSSGTSTSVSSQSGSTKPARKSASSEPSRGDPFMHCEFDGNGDGDSDTSELDTPTKMPPKKRKRMIMESVELPTLRQVHMQKAKRRASLEFAPVGSNDDCIHKSGLRRTQSARILGESLSSRPSRPLPRKGRSSPLEDVSTPRAYLKEEEALTPMRNLLDAQLIGSDDSIMLEQEELDTALPSSDDDPHLGLVTPRHLVSPVVRRLFDESDPPSDDSVMSASPSRELVARRLERQGSLKMAVKPRSLLFTPA